MKDQAVIEKQKIIDQHELELKRHKKEVNDFKLKVR